MLNTEALDALANEAAYQGCRRKQMLVPTTTIEALVAEVRAWRTAETQQTYATYGLAHPNFTPCKTVTTQIAHPRGGG